MAEVRMKIDEITGEMVEDNSKDASSYDVVSSSFDNSFNNFPSFSEDFEWPEEEISLLSQIPTKPRKSKGLPAKRSKKGIRYPTVDCLSQDDSVEESVLVEVSPKKKSTSKTSEDSKSSNIPDEDGIFTLYAHKADLKKGFDTNINLNLWRHDEQGLLQKFGRNEENLSHFHSTVFYFRKDDRKNEFFDVKVKCLNDKDMSTVAVMNEDDIQEICAKIGRKWSHFKPLMPGKTSGKADRSQPERQPMKENQGKL